MLECYFLVERPKDKRPMAVSLQLSWNGQQRLQIDYFVPSSSILDCNNSQMVSRPTCIHSLFYANGCVPIMSNSDVRNASLRSIIRNNWISREQRMAICVLTSKSLQTRHNFSLTIKMSEKLNGAMLKSSIL